MRSLEEIVYVNEKAPRKIGRLTYHADCVPSHHDEDDVDVLYQETFPEGVRCFECYGWIIKPTSKSTIKRIKAMGGDV